MPRFGRSLRDAIYPTSRSCWPRVVGLRSQSAAARRCTFYGSGRCPSDRPVLWEGPPRCCLVPGGHGVGETWHLQAQRLARKGFAALAMDYRGRGHSGGAPHDDEKVHLDVLGAVQQCGVRNRNCACAAPGRTTSSFGSGVRRYWSRIESNLSRPEPSRSSSATMKSFRPPSDSGFSNGLCASSTSRSIRPGSAIAAVPAAQPPQLAPTTEI